MDDQQLHETIEAYLQQQMSPKEAAAFEAQMAADPVLAERVDLQRLTLRATDLLAEQSLQEKLARWRTEADAEVEELPVPQPAPARKISPWLLAAAMFLLLAGAFWAWEMWNDPQIEIRKEENKSKRETNDSLPNNQLGKDTIASGPNPPDDKTARFLALANDLADVHWKKTSARMTRGNSVPESPEDSLLAQADSLLKINQYKSAASLLKKIPPGSPFEPSALKRLAFICHKLGQHDQAIVAYQQYIDLPTFSDTEEDDWLLCLYYLADWPYHKKEFKALLRKMTKDRNHGYHSQARDLKRKLR